MNFTCSGLNSFNLESIINSTSLLKSSESELLAKFLFFNSSIVSLIFVFNGSFKGSKAFSPPTICSIDPNDDSFIASISLK